MEKCSLLGGLGVLPQKMFVFLSSLDLISCNFSIIFAHFQTKRDITRGAKTLQWGGQRRGWGGFGPSSIYVKKGPAPPLKEIPGLSRTSINFRFSKISKTNTNIPYKCITLITVHQIYHIQNINKLYLYISNVSIFINKCSRFLD